MANPTESTRLGRTAVQVTRLGLGCASLGNLFQAVAHEEAQAVVHRAYEAGIRFFDTAPYYGLGLAEKRVGEALRTYPRDSFVLSTKVGRLLEPDPGRERAIVRGDRPVWVDCPPLAPVFDFSYDGVMRSFEASLERLGLDRVDVLHIHDPDRHYDEAISAAYRALAELRAQGVVRAVGAGMNQAPMLARFAEEADFDCFLLAGRYTLLDQSGGDHLLPTCLARGISVIAAGVYRNGLLADPNRKGGYDYGPPPEALVLQARRLAAACEVRGVPLKAAAIQFPLRHPAVASVLVGAQSVVQLEENLAAFQAAVPSDLWEDLTEA